VRLKLRGTFAEVNRYLDQADADELMMMSYP
jgi:hypothetical protein